MSEIPILCDTKSSTGNMDCSWNGAKHDQISARSKPMSETLSKLAQLITCMEYKPKSQKSSSVCKNYEQQSSNPNAQKNDDSFPKPHRCHPCGQKFALLSSLQLHKCPRLSTICQTCKGKPMPNSSCPSCGIEFSGTNRIETSFCPDDINISYACAACGQEFSHKQELLYHQQAGNCQPMNPHSSSYSSMPSECSVCSRNFRSPAGLSCHMRSSHPQMLKKKKNVISVSTMRRKKKSLLSAVVFPCRSCDKTFPKTSLLHRHRKEEHRREIKLRNPLKKNAVKISRRREKGETYPCLHCGKEFLHHLTRWAHFKHYSSHHKTHLKLNNKIKADGFISKVEVEAPRLPRPRGRPRKYPIPVSKREEEIEETDEDEDSQFPCTSCDRVFGSKASLFAHEKIHEELPEEMPEEEQDFDDTRVCCGVCEGRIEIEGIQENCEMRVYHCVPCDEVFTEMNVFLEHCQKHLIREKEDEFSDD